MSEALPVFRGGELIGYTALSTEFSVTGLRGEGRSVYLWGPRGAWRVDGVVEAGGFRFDPRVWAVYAPLEAWRSINLLEDLVSWIERGAGWRLRGRRLLLSYSGGKDSTAALIVLDALYDRLDFHLDIVHVHMPYLEPEYHIDEALRLASRLGWSVEVIEPPRRVLARRLLEEGLPWRRARWCTYYKTRPLDEFFEERGYDYMVVGDRKGESIARSRRLRPDTLFDRRRFEPIKHLTLIDVALLVRSQGLVHRDYQLGLTRVSCRYCPYKSLPELVIEEGVGGDEDPGLIEEVLRREWRRWYRRIPLQDFMENHYWRYPPRIARAFHEAKKRFEGREPSLGPLDQARLNRSIWEAPIEALEALPVVNLYESRVPRQQ